MPAWIALAAMRSPADRPARTSTWPVADGFAGAHLAQLRAARRVDHVDGGDLAAAEQRRGGHREHAAPCR